MKKMLLAPLALLWACGGATPPPADTAANSLDTPAPSASATAPTADLPASPATSAAPVASAAAPASSAPAANAPPALPEFSATPDAQLKKLHKADVTGAVKLGKEGDDWATVLGKVTTKLGPQTFISRSLSADASTGDAYYWSFVHPDGACDQLLVMATKDGKKVDTMKLKQVGKAESILPEGGGKPVSGCTGQPR